MGRAPKSAAAWKTLNERIVTCDRCERLLTHCQHIATEKRAAFREWKYWGRPVPNFGSSEVQLLIVGLAPAAHGANRTGRMFTGDRSGEWLYRALHKAGFANQPHSHARDDGLELRSAAITAVCHCAPPENKPLPEEIEHCHEWFSTTIALANARVFLALGHIAWNAVVDEARTRSWLSGARPKFGHGAKAAFADGRWLIGSYHPSQQNTFTGRLTEPMFDAVFTEIRRLLKSDAGKANRNA